MKIDDDLKSEIKAKKLKPKDIMGNLKAALKRLECFLKAPVVRLINYENLRKHNFAVEFLHEGNEIIQLPRTSIIETVLGTGINVNRNFDYSTRPNAEVLLRKTVFEMFKNGYINSNCSILDIGSWISDNSIVWSKYLTRNAIIIAIDPSSKNLSYGKTVAELNNINNIKWVEAVCSEKAGMKLDYDGSIDHASFKNTDSGNYIMSSTIDDIVEEENVVIGLFHVDVEGFELSVLKGAKSVILRDKPVITFEQHISEEDFKLVSQYIKSFDYRIFMINEVLPGCSLDCRNFVAFPSEKGLPTLSSFDQANGKSMGIYSAVIGSRLIEVFA